MPDWAAFASLGTAAGTLILAVATFASVRSGRRAAEVAERALLAGTQPILAPSRIQDPEMKVMFQEEHWVTVAGGGAVAEVTDGAIYLAISLRNVGSGLAVLHGYIVDTENILSDPVHAKPESFRRLTRDLYIPSGDVGFWQGALREPAAPGFAAVSEAIKEPRPFRVDLLYGDHEGGQRVISRFILTAHERGWLAAVARHWNVDRPQPR